MDKVRVLKHHAFQEVTAELLNSIATTLFGMSDGIAQAFIAGFQNTDHLIFQDLDVTPDGSNLAVSCGLKGVFLYRTDAENSIWGVYKGTRPDKDTPYSEEILPLTAADPTNPRIDIIEAEIVEEDDVDYFQTVQMFNPGTETSFAQDQYTKRVRNVKLYIKDGTPASSPVAPAVTAGRMVVKEVYVGAAATSLSSANIISQAFDPDQSPWSISHQTILFPSIYDVASVFMKNPIWGSYAKVPSASSIYSMVKQAAYTSDLQENSVLDDNTQILGMSANRDGGIVVSSYKTTANAFRIYRSLGYGVAFTLSDTMAGLDDIGEIALFKNDYHYVAVRIAPDIIIRRSNGGAWADMFTIAGDMSRKSIGANADYIIVGTTNNILKSSDGSTWSTHSNAGSASVLRDVAMFGENKALLVYGVGPDHFQVFDLVSNVITPITPIDNSGVSTMYLCCDHGNNVLIVGASQNSTHLFWRSVDGGVSWSGVWERTGAEAGVAVPSIRYGNGVWFAVVGGSLYSSSDEGLKWYRVDRQAVFVSGAMRNVFFLRDYFAHVVDGGAVGDIMLRTQRSMNLLAPQHNVITAQYY